MVYFTSDCHIGHKNILKYRLQFRNSRENSLYFINKILRLSKRDVLYILGDFIFDCPEYDEYISLLSRKKCRIKLVMGNHDSLKLYKEDIFEMQLPLFSYKNMWISHCPIHSTELRNRLGNIHGHLHNSILPDERYFDVCPEKHDFDFVTLDTIKEYFEHNTDG